MNLPADLAGPLQIPGPERSSIALWVALVVMLILLILGWVYLRSRLRRPGAPAGSRDRTAAAPSTIADAIRALLTKHLESTDVRDGCHELSGLLRGYYDHRDLGRARRLPFSRMTARELQQRLGKHRVAELFVDLARLQFSSARPNRGTFRELSRRAIRLIEGEPKTSRARRPSCGEDAEPSP